MGTYAITGVVANGTGLASDYSGDPDQRHADGEPVRLQLHDRQRQPDLRHAADLATDLRPPSTPASTAQNLAISYSSTGDTATAHVGTYAITGVVPTARVWPATTA